MVKKFLNAKHWQLFIPFFGIPVLLYIIIMVITFISLASGFDPTEISSDPGSYEAIKPPFGLIKGLVVFYPMIILLIMGTFFGWMLSVGNGLQNKMPEGVVMEVQKFKMALLFPLIYFLVLCLGFVFLLLYGGSIIGLATSAIGILLFFIFHLSALMCMLYSMYFVAKTIKTVEIQKPVTIGDFAGEFFLIWFFFIGVWILQPKVNKYAQDDWPPQEFV